MSKWFCTKSGGVDTVVKMAAFTAGSLVARNNPDLMKTVLPVAQGIMKTVDAGGDNVALNAIFQEAVTELLGQVKGLDPLIEVAIMGVLSSISFTPGGVSAALTNTVIQDVVDGFVNGMGSVK